MPLISLELPRKFRELRETSSLRITTGVKA